VIWNEKRFDVVKNTNNELLAYFHLVMDRLKDIMRPLPKHLKQKIIHGDLTGNFLSRIGDSLESLI